MKDKEQFLKEQVDGFYSVNPIVDKIAALRSSYRYYSEEAQKLKVLYEMGGVSQSVYEEIQFRVEGLRLQLRELENTASLQHEEMKSQHQTVLGQLDEIESSLEEIRISIEETVFKAPFDGVVSFIASDEGDLVMPNQPLVKVEEPSGYKVVLSLSEGDLSKVKLGSEANLIINGGEYEGEVSMVSPQVNETTRRGSVEVVFSEPEKAGGLLVGASVTVEIHNQQRIEGLFVPAEAVRQLGEETVVYVANEDNTVSQRKVETGREVSGMVEILEGLDPLERVAVRGIESLYDQASIYVLNGEG
ncbi:MAG: hypothetical protein AVO33_01855 [delta proteobacterium ML8_F1]|nr:MAG: hypothetical protein AVO33_01855 [delta proteobacterium ML8_F1]